MEGGLTMAEGRDSSKSEGGSSEVGERRTALGARTLHRTVQLRGGDRKGSEGEVEKEVEREHYQWAASQAVEVSSWYGEMMVRGEGIGQSKVG